MFFLETSNSSVLSVRQACSVESGLRMSGRFVVLLLTSAVINICHQTFRKYKTRNIILKLIPMFKAFSLCQISFSFTSTRTLWFGRKFWTMWNVNKEYGDGESQFEIKGTLRSKQCSLMAGWQDPAVRQSTSVTSSDWQFYTGLLVLICLHLLKLLNCVLVFI